MELTSQRTSRSMRVSRRLISRLHPHNPILPVQHIHDNLPFLVRLRNGIVPPEGAVTTLDQHPLRPERVQGARHVLKISDILQEGFLNASVRQEQPRLWDIWRDDGCLWDDLLSQLPECLGRHEFRARGGDHDRVYHQLADLALLQRLGDDLDCFCRGEHAFD